MVQCRGCGFPGSQLCLVRELRSIYLSAKTPEHKQKQYCNELNKDFTKINKTVGKLRNNLIVQKMCVSVYQSLSRV